eukprot:Sspe_Gene.68324::Locus_40308_Transcript_1_1_Confidence_1.000_Length_1877::g.68324::m.68324
MLLAVLLFAAAGVFAVDLSGGGGVSLTVSNNGSYELFLDGVSWLSSGDTPTLYGAKLTLKNPPSETSGTHPKLGSYKGATMTWGGSQGSVEATIMVFASQPAVLFRQTFPSEVKGSGAPDDVVSVFPSFQTGSIDKRAISWGGNQLSETQLVSWQHFDGGQEQGMPFLLYNHTLRSVMIGPYGNFLVGIHASGANGKSLNAGVRASIGALPAGFTHDTLLYAGQGVNNTLYEWGELLLQRTGKQRVNPYDDFVLSNLGYWTDHGGYYYRNKRNYSNLEEALKAVKADAMAQNIPIQYFQWDDWWFPENRGDSGGMVNWTAITTIFPDGMTDWLKMPLSLYMPMYYSENVYVGKYPFVFDNKTKNALPVSRKFFDDIFAQGKAIGMRMFEQDFMSTTNTLTDLTRTNLTAGDDWLNGMGDAANDAGITLQYCMMHPCHTLKSSEVKAVTNGRASKDATGVPNLHLVLGLSGMLHWAVGIWPSADNVWTSQVEGGDTRPDAPGYQSVLAVMVGGPYGPSDAVGAMNKSLIMRSCRSDGVLLKPDKPLTALESSFVAALDNYHFTIWGTNSDVGGYRWGYVMGLDLKEAYSVPITDIHPDTSRK